MTLDKEALQGLLDRVREAKGPDRELDLDIAAALFTDGEDASWWARRKDRFLSSHMLVDAAPEYTASVDAALALVERLLPGEGIVLETHGQPVAGIGQSGKYPSKAATPPLAILSALLSALLSAKLSQEADQ